MSLIEWIKWHLIVFKSVITNSTVIDMFGSTWIVSGNVVKKFGE